MHYTLIVTICNTLKNKTYNMHKTFSAQVTKCYVSLTCHSPYKFSLTVYFPKYNLSLSLSDLT